MRLLFALTYYDPHISGLTTVAQRLAEALVARGHRVTVLASQHAGELPLEETVRGVRVVRVPVAFRVSKAPLMLGYLGSARRLLREHDAVVMHLPNTPVEASVLSLLSRLVIRRPVVAAYHCDLALPGGVLARMLSEAAFLSNVVAGTLAARVVASSDDYARHSRFLRLFRRKRVTVPYAVELPAPDAASVEAFRQRHAPGGERLIGFAARLAAEKGVEYLLDALPQVRAAYPGARILFTGDSRSAVGEEAYRRRIAPLLARAGDGVTFLGVLDWREMATFYAACDATVLPSVNRTESFGLVQLESMLCGTPVVASDLPGVRVPVRTTGMGRLAPPRDASALADALVEVIRRRETYLRPRAEVERHFSFDVFVRGYEELLESLLNRDAKI